MRCRPSAYRASHSRISFPAAALPGHGAAHSRLVQLTADIQTNSAGRCPKGQRKTFRPAILAGTAGAGATGFAGAAVFAGTFIFSKILPELAAPRVARIGNESVRREHR